VSQPRLRLEAAWTTWLALGVWLAVLALTAVTGVMKALGWHGAGNTSSSGLVALLIAFLSFATMGALVAALVPRNAIGWLFLATAIGAAFGGTAENYAYHGLVHSPGSLPAAVAVAWMYSWAWYPTVALILFVPILFPTGAPPAGGWRWVVRAQIAFTAGVTAIFMLNPGPLDGSDSQLPDNPVGIRGLAPIVDHLDPVLITGFAVFALAGLASIVLRFRRSRGDERQQIKAMLFAVALLLVGLMGPDLVGLSSTGAGDVVFSATVLMLPVAVAVAMLKYRLYDVDRVINKTLVYGTSTAILGAIYVGLVLGGQALFASVAGGSHYAVAGSTLVVAALFLPLRRRVQSFVDRRFYRRRYDAQQTLARFSARVREHVELDRLVRELEATVAETMQPTHVTLWVAGSREA
jgi:hypothetical protein